MRDALSQEKSIDMDRRFSPLESGRYLVRARPDGPANNSQWMN